jgi:hypothetical protein
LRFFEHCGVKADSEQKISVTKFQPEGLNPENLPVTLLGDER